MRSGLRRRAGGRASRRAGGQAVDEGLLQGLRGWAVGEDGRASVRGVWRSSWRMRRWYFEKCGVTGITDVGVGSVVVRRETKGELSTVGEQWTA
ncbi:hypothetical protein LY76DRAFT_587213 [Colletotrichum caudatum]|nr:hypothetical protein LY76DRAFT_587213 [Colletotrichum caudatum]